VGESAGVMENSRRLKRHDWHSAANATVTPETGPRLASNMPHPMRRRLRLLVPLAVGLIAWSATSLAANAEEQKHPDVIAVKVQARGPETFDFDVTVSSPYDTAQRYADAFRVMGKDGTIFGERKLLHDHATEQPFIRDLHGVKIPRELRTVIIQARDRKHGYGGKTIEAALPGR